MPSEYIFAVGSENPIKINCVANAVKAFWPDARAIGVNTDSGVSAQPGSDHEMLTGALNRARQSLAKTPEAQFGVGLEGGTLDSEDGMWAYAWIVVVDRTGHVGKGQSGRFLLPEAVAQMVRDGIELGEADDRFFGRSNSKQQDGAIGILSDGVINRLDLYQPAVVFALLPFVHPEFYEMQARQIK
ncbi:MAG: inosine/xanthosine triphosphatase [Blastocatellia bacterium]